MLPKRAQPEAVLPRAPSESELEAEFEQASDDDAEWKRGPLPAERRSEADHYQHDDPSWEYTTYSIHDGFDHAMIFITSMVTMARTVTSLPIPAESESDSWVIATAKHEPQHFAQWLCHHH